MPRRSDAEGGIPTPIPVSDTASEKPRCWAKAHCAKCSMWFDYELVSGNRERLFCNACLAPQPGNPRCEHGREKPHWVETGLSKTSCDGVPAPQPDAVPHPETRLNLAECVVDALEEAERLRYDWDEFPDGSLMTVADLVKEVVAVSRRSTSPQHDAPVIDKENG